MIQVLLLISAFSSPGEDLWSLRALDSSPAPTVNDTDWVATPIDAYILAGLEARGLRPAAAADRRSLLRRLTLDLTGLPPTPERLRAFEAAEHPDAYAREVNRLLGSPAYGERWGRHWLDVVRYADCNGADESQAYPNAYHFRNYVIHSFNEDLPYDRFVKEQIAGDLLPASETRGYDPTVGTGFLVLGTKILAERDVPKMQADIVDEQIDTIGRAFLGLTVACARCHDHKFDPIPTADYYALAGILRSTKTMKQPGRWHERPVHTRRTFAASRAFEQSGRLQLAKAERELESFRSVRKKEIERSNAVEFEAETYARGNVVVDKENYGKGIGIVSDPGSQKNFVEWDVERKTSGAYLLHFRYAAARSRPMRLLVNGRLVRERAIAEVTGSWHPDGQRWLPEGRVELKAGRNVLRLENDGNVSHLDKVRLIDVKGAPELAKIDREIQAAEAKRNELAKIAPKPASVMAVQDGEIRNERIHVRGSHLTLGDEVDRGFLRVVKTAESREIPGKASGRLQLADWMTSKSHPLTARVLVNRVWGWHFGQPLVTTTENFGLRGEKPSHPALLDYLARELQQDDWSIKSLNRQIVLSNTYRMSWVRDAKAEEIDPNNRLRWRYDRRRLSAEAIRDSVLFVTGKLDREVGGAPLTLPSYDLTTEQLRGNRKFYQDSRRRTVYLPVLRTN
ncbi:MAG: DUF1549 domain-containing protein, partial [Planctomycetota bacterium]